jgi:hypothetical protein
VLSSAARPCPIGGFELDPLPAELPVQHGKLTAQGEDRRVVVAVAARQQP